MASIFRLTPITPVDATSTWDGAHPIRLAASTAISRASAMPCGPVQALAHPLLVTMACATPPLHVRCSWRDEHGGGLRLVRGEDRRRADRAIGGERGRDRACPMALMPHAIPAARKPAGAVMPPSMGVIATRPSCARSAPRQRQDHRMLAALSEERTVMAVERDFLGHPDVRHDGEALADEVRRVVREGASASRSRRGSRSSAARRRAGGRCRAIAPIDRRRAIAPPPRVALSGASSAQPRIFGRRAVDGSPTATTKRAACTESSSSERGRRWPSSTFAAMSA